MAASRIFETFSIIEGAQILPHQHLVSGSRISSHLAYLPEESTVQAFESLIERPYQPYILPKKNDIIDRKLPSLQRWSVGYNHDLGEAQRILAKFRRSYL